MNFSLSLTGMAAATVVAITPLPAISQETAPPPSATRNDLSAFILTPKPPATPRINGPRIYAARPGRPFLYTIPTTGERPMTFAAQGLPDGLVLDATTGRIAGQATQVGNYNLTLTARNARGSYSRTFEIVIGDKIALTPPLGWNSWNCFAGAVDAEKIRAQAKAMVASGLIDHGWTYINIDDTWQGQRSGSYRAIQGNEKFPDMKGLCDEVHAMGLKAGIYSTPWVTSYANHAGGSAMTADGAWTKPNGPKQVNRKTLPWHMGPYPFARADAKQWADWGFDYLKYDWNPIEVPQVREMNDALRSSGRDVVLSLSNSAPFSGAADWARHANAWRTTGDIRDTWRSVTSIGFGQDKWSPYSGPGHWNDPDMLVVGMVGWGPKLHPTGLTPDEQYTHITLWSLLAAPLLIGCDMTQLDEFTLSLLTNDEVLAVNQDPLGKQARRIRENKDAGTEVWARPLEDGTFAVGLFNRGRYEVIDPRRPRAGEPEQPRVWKLTDRATGQSTEFPTQAEAGEALHKTLQPALITVLWSDLTGAGAPLSDLPSVRDLWRQQDIGAKQRGFTAAVAPHGAMLIRVGTPIARGGR